MFAVLKTGGKQYKVEENQILMIEKISASAGEVIQFNEVLMLGGDHNVLGQPNIEGAGVQARVIDQIKEKKVISFVKRRRKHSSQRTRGHRQNKTLMKILKILEKGAEKSGVRDVLEHSNSLLIDNVSTEVGTASTKKAKTTGVAKDMRSASPKEISAAVVTAESSKKVKKVAKDDSVKKTAAVKKVSKEKKADVAEVPPKKKVEKAVTDKSVKAKSNMVVKKKTSEQKPKITKSKD